MQYKDIYMKQTRSQSTITIRVDEELKKNFDKLCDEFGFSNTAAFTIFMKAVVREKRIPFEIKVTDTESEIRAKAIDSFERMRSAAQKSEYAGITLQQINSIIQEARNAR